MTMRKKMKQAFSYSFSRRGTTITQTISDNLKINFKVFAPVDLSYSTGFLGKRVSMHVPRPKNLEFFTKLSHFDFYIAIV